jgi:hypothetical protein
MGFEALVEVRTSKMTTRRLALVVLAAVAAGRASAGESSSAARDHWAWKPPVRPETPAVKDRGWVRNPIDAFVLAKLETAGLGPAPPAPRETLLRRATLDVTGLPPTPEEIDSFLSDDSPGAWEAVVDRLLASARYGERWGRHWLDLARYADSNGYEHDEPRPDAWRYRDYVVSSFNADKPYDRFIEEQLAGDELFPSDPQALVATGFNLLGPDMTDSADQAQRRHHTLTDMTDTASLVFLGLTAGCARCHDHKFEPIPQSDYYRLQAFFAPAAFRSDLPLANETERAAHEAALRRYQASIAPLRDEIAKLEEPHRRRFREEKLSKLSEDAQLAHRKPERERTAAERELVEKTGRLISVSAEEVSRALSSAEEARRRELGNEIKKFDGLRPRALPVAMGLRDPEGAAPRTFLLHRGELTNPGEEVAPGFPGVLPGGAAGEGAEAGRQVAGRRARLARWIARPENPLMSRVMANRLWQHHFGRGIVPTPSDFGLRGERPSHPELLDFLATEFAARGFRMKSLHKLILMSATYRQSSRPPARAEAIDPQNTLLSHWSRRRLEGETIRDALLASSGRLNDAMGGPGVFPPLPHPLEGSAGWKPASDPREGLRRSIYIFARRNLRFPFLEAFDLPDTNLSCPRREESTTAPQALALLNAPEVEEAAAALASKIESEARPESDRVALAYRRVLGRAPAAGELALAHQFLRESPLHELCRALYNLNEFVYLE